MEFIEMFKKAKIDTNHVIFEIDSNGYTPINFELKPTDFIEYSKVDYNENNVKGLINSITNSKRAVDCQADRIVSYLGIQSKTIPKAAVKYISLESELTNKRKIPINLKLLEALKFAPVSLILSLRSQRNKLEHQYKLPKNDDVKNLLELAELFYYATEFKLTTIESFVITDKKKFNKSKNSVKLFNRETEIRYSSGLHISFDEDYSEIKINLINGIGEKEYYTIDNKQIEFYYLLRIAISFHSKYDIAKAFSKLLKTVEFPSSIEKIDIRI